MARSYQGCCARVCCLHGVSRLASASRSVIISGRAQFNP
jgi:hypothetical protein